MLEIKSPFLSSCSRSLRNHRLFMPHSVTRAVRGCGCWQCEQGYPLPCRLPSPDSKIPGNICCSCPPPEKPQERCMRGPRGVMDRGTMDVDRCPAWRARTGHAKSSALLPRGGELKIPFFPGVKATRCLAISRLEGKKKESHCQLSNQTDWEAVLWGRSPSLAAKPARGLKARNFYERFIHL